MKRIVLLSLVAIFVLGMTSCHKEGTFNPSQKIEKVYVEKDGGDVQAKYLSEEWEWDGNLLESITHYNSKGDKIYVGNYSYDKKKRLTCIDENNGTKINYTYDGKYLTAIEYTYNGKTLSKATIEHDGKKISKITTTSYDTKANMAHALRFFVPEESIAQFEAAEAKAKNQVKGGSSTTIMNLTWNGKNVSAVELISELNGNTSSETTVYAYDNCKNPIYNFLDEDYFGVSKNNIIEQASAAYSITYTYDYDKHDYPVKKSWKTSTWGGEIVTSNYYEYED
ncbi:MAG: hypothetical protein MJZ76_05740 [Bacteroidales bacterium]|nr:hypothetical protein [Bacteroidales bacterium]